MPQLFVYKTINHAGDSLAFNLNIPSFMKDKYKKSDSKAVDGGRSMRRTKMSLLVILSMGMLFIVRLCTVTPMQSKRPLSGVSREKAAAKAAVDDLALRNEPGTEPDRVTGNEGGNQRTEEPVEQDESNPEPPKFSDGHADSNLHHPNIPADSSRPEGGSEIGCVKSPEKGAESADADAAESGRAGAGNETEETGDIGIRIVQIAVSEESSENLEIVILSDSSTMASAFSGGFHLEGNDDRRPCCLMVRTKDETGDELIQYLPWNQEHPNEFHPSSPLRGYASVAVYESQKLVGRFYVTDFAGRETIPLDLNLCRIRQLAVL
jgi:hypothetical protein